MTIKIKVNSHRVLSLILATHLLVNPAQANSNQVAAELRKVGSHYVTLAHHMYLDALHTADTLDKQLRAFIATPDAASHDLAKQAWIAAHTVYSQTEVFRFGNPNVDDWEGQVNAWPMDEGLLDYVANDYVHEESNAYADANIIQGEQDITETLLRGLHEKAGSEANVATGYHAIEFLLWGQDLNTAANSAGQRSFTDYLQTDKCTNPQCERRAIYLQTVSALLLQDLTDMVAQWDPETGSYAREFVALPATEQVRRILFGMGNLGFGELAGERIRVALLASAQEDEQSCFSDTTDVAIYNNALAVRNIYRGYYLSSRGEEFSGPSLHEVVSRLDPKLHALMEQQFALSMASAYEISSAAEQGEVFDRQIHADNAAGRERLQKMIDRLRNQTKTIETISDRLASL